jgi:hypothetical protein
MNRVNQMQEIHREAIERDIVNCDADNIIDWNNPIKSLEAIIDLGVKLKNLLIVTSEFVTIQSRYEVREILFDIHNITILAYGILDNFTNNDNPAEYIKTRPEKILELIERVHGETLEIFKKKNSDYGDAFATYGTIGVIVRIGDKIMRIKSLSSNKTSINQIENKVMDESIKDTLYDLINYAAMALMLMIE